jgi:hypothetical protein
VGVDGFLYPVAAAAAVAGAAGLVILVRVPPRQSARAALAGTAIVVVAVSAATLVPRTGRETGVIEHRADLAQSLGTIMAMAPPRSFSAARHVSVEGAEVTALAWRLGVVPHDLGHAGAPGVALEIRDVPWARFDRRVAVHHLLVRPLATDEELSLVSVTRRQ